MKRLALGLLITFATTTAHAADDPAARKILDDTLRKSSAGFQSGQSTTLLTQTLQNGKQKTWKTLARVQRKDGRVRTRVTFLEPAEHVGVELLLVEEADKTTSQWLWLPKTKRMRRIGGSQKDQDFMGTDFSFGDLESKGMNAGESKLVGRETVGGVPCAKIDVKATGPEELYGRIVAWVDDAKAVVRKVEFYGKDGALTKTLTAESVREVDGRPLIDKLKMQHHVRGSVTLVETRDVNTAASFADGLFVPENLGK
jgi:hypothetical protein